jgi:hypothetical protein
MPSKTAQRIRPLVLLGLLCALSLVRADETPPAAQPVRTKAPAQALHPLPKKTTAQIKAELRAVLLRLNELSYYMAATNDAVADANGAITVNTFECNGPVQPNSQKPWPPKIGDAMDTPSFTRVVAALKAANTHSAEGRELTIRDVCHPL